MLVLFYTVSYESARLYHFPFLKRLQTQNQCVLLKSTKLDIILRVSEGILHTLHVLRNYLFSLPLAQHDQHHFCTLNALLKAIRICCDN